MHNAISIKTGPTEPKTPAGFASIAYLLGVLEHSKFVLNVAVFVRHEYFLHPQSGNLPEVSREPVHSYMEEINCVSTYPKPSPTHCVDATIKLFLMVNALAKRVVPIKQLSSTP